MSWPQHCDITALPLYKLGQQPQLPVQSRWDAPKP